ncbi:uncharacterized protein LOC120320821 [Drosophila yakuba]|uniref:uncharacterized protein LOC120320821 n=1 Tax=Drosophila yakuba TaxID=7245 RepID=UPI001930852C|nr:uncharacterized protein LOC120320821 [Drosophila yakuba]
MKLVQGQKALCSFSNADHVPKIEEVDDGIILLNDYDGNATWNNTELHLEGTYLVQLSNDSIIIDNQQFSNLEPTVSTPGAPLVQFTAEEKERLKVLSLEALEALHINNTEQSSTEAQYQLPQFNDIPYF